MSDKKISSLSAYKATELMLTMLYKRLDSDPIRVIPSGMVLTENGSLDAAFLDSWNEQMLKILKGQTDVEGSFVAMATKDVPRTVLDIPMSANEGFDVFVGFLGDYERTLMSGKNEYELLTSLRAEQKLPVEDRPTNGYWKQWLSFLSMVKT